MQTLTEILNNTDESDLSSTLLNENYYIESGDLETINRDFPYDSRKKDDHYPEVLIVHNILSREYEEDVSDWRVKPVLEKIANEYKSNKGTGLDGTIKKTEVPLETWKKIDNINKEVSSYLSEICKNFEHEDKANYHFNKAMAPFNSLFQSIESEKSSKLGLRYLNSDFSKPDFEYILKKGDELRKNDITDNSAEAYAVLRYLMDYSRNNNMETATALKEAKEQFHIDVPNFDPVEKSRSVLLVNKCLNKPLLKAGLNKLYDEIETTKGPTRYSLEMQMKPYMTEIRNILNS